MTATDFATNLLDRRVTVSERDGSRDAGFMWREVAVGRVCVVAIVDGRVRLTLEVERGDMGAMAADTCMPAAPGDLITFGGDCGPPVKFSIVPNVPAALVQAYKDGCMSEAERRRALLPLPPPNPDAIIAAGIAAALRARDGTGWPPAGDGAVQRICRACDGGREPPPGGGCQACGGTGWQMLGAAGWGPVAK